jgi:hypothetical protein
MTKYDTNEGYFCGELSYKVVCAVNNGPCPMLPYFLTI